MRTKKTKCPKRAEAAMRGWLAYQEKVRRLDVLNVALKMYDIPFKVRYVSPKKMKWVAYDYERCYQYKFKWWEVTVPRTTPIIDHPDNSYFDTEPELTAHVYTRIAEQIATLDAIAELEESA